MSDIPEELLYTREHEWIKIDGNKAVVGITDHAQKSLGDIVYVDEIQSFSDKYFGTKWAAFLACFDIPTTVIFFNERISLISSSVYVSFSI